jgi:fermentation-respiration switch protein FrsA (DUF1100 family)
MTFLVSFLKFALIIYVCFAALMTVFQRSFIYFPTQFDAYPVSQLLNKNIRIYETDNLKWLWLPTEKPKHFLIYFHGNAGSAIDRVDKAEMWRRRGFDVMLVEYPGYGLHNGKPSEQNFYQTGRMVLKEIQERFPNIPTSLYGESIGSGTTVQMATEFDVKGIILETPFTSLKDIVQSNYPFLPVRYLLWDHYLNKDKINDINADLFIIHGTDDTIIPYQNGRELYDVYNGRKEFYSLEGAAHNDVYFHSDINTIISDISRRLF